MIDLRQRAADQSYLRFRLRDDKRLAVPEVLWDYCNDSVLTTRAIETAALSDAQALASCGLDQADVVATSSKRSSKWRSASGCITRDSMRRARA